MSRRVVFSSFLVLFLFGVLTDGQILKLTDEKSFSVDAIQLAFGEIESPIVPAGRGRIIFF